MHWNAVPPLPAGPASSLTWPGISSEAAAGTFRLRCPARSPGGLVGPHLGVGYCLEPLFPDGRALRWFDPRIAADDGDFVLVELAEAVLAEIVENNRHRPEFIEAYGTNPPSLALKWLRHYRRTQYLCEAKHGIPLGDNRILGVCTYVLIDGVPVYGSGPECGYWSDIGREMQTPEIDLSGTSGTVDTVQIAEEAVTELYQVAAGNLSGFSGTTNLHDLSVLDDAGGEPITSGSTTLIMPDTENDSTAIVTGTFIGRKGAAGTVSVYPYLLNVDTLAESLGEEYPLTTTDQNITVHYQFPLSEGQQYRVGMRAQSSAATNQEIYTGPLVVMVHVAKR